MKKILRSLAWVDHTEKDEIKKNYEHVQTDRLLNTAAAERKVLDHLMTFYQNSGEPTQLQLALDHFEASNESDAVTLVEEIAAQSPYLAASFKQLFEEEVEDQAAQNLAATAKLAIKIATQGAQIGKSTVKGTDEAVAYLYSSIREKPKDQTNRQPASMKASSKEISQLYQDRKANPYKTYGILTGYGLFDSATAGIRKKQLMLNVGFGGHLKSTLMLNMVINAAVNGWNPLIFTSEMPAEDLKLLLVAIHSADPKFNAVASPVSR